MNPTWFMLVLAMLVSIVYGFDNHNSDCGNSTTVLSRRKRYLIFRDLSRGFIRVNVKDRMVDSTNIWAQGVGFRLNVEYNNPPGLKITKRDLHQSLGEMLHSHGFDGRACVLRTFCEISNAITPSSGILFKLFRRIFSHPATTDDSSTGSNSLPQGDETYFPYLKSSDCQELDRHCPISQLEIPDDSAIE
ncbi:uncharacterized protein LOC129774848 [Toxorhynchites rutilus septentrionalis]|uniref:uncharacterized protein LOC129774848 n=1 Tax=Toxorhynchites rutilus septentrionalis TaxID=329112 RepID=UPI00247A8775|nr:uncharacterized protein LOC129774848 [Toxorhynchites rutilus septentrionalis]